MQAAAMRAAGFRPVPIRTPDDIIGVADLYEFNERLLHTYLRDAAELCLRAGGENAREVRESAPRGAPRSAEQAAFVYEKAAMRSR